MKKARFLRTAILNLFFIVCYSQHSHSQSPDSLINKDSIRSIIEFLASDSLRGRFTGSAGAETAAHHIANEFRVAGLRGWDSTTNYLFPFLALDGSATGYNVIGVLPGQEKSDELVIFSAHYDHVGTVSTNPYSDYRPKRITNGTDTIFNGANDNASGTSALISLAHYFGALKNNKRTIVFIAFSGEELGLVGSQALAMSLKNASSIICLVNLDMLGRGEYPFITGSELGNLQPILNKELARIDRANYGKHYFKNEPNREQRLFTRSDNYPFALLRIPAYTVMSTTDNDIYYHTVQDEPQTLDYQKIERIARAVGLAMDPIINKGIRPWRIDASNYSRPEAGY